MTENNSIHKTAINALIDELTTLNGHICGNRNMFELFKHNGLFLFGFNPESKVASDAYRRYISFITIITHVLEEFDIRKKYNGYAYMVDSVMLIMDQNKLDLRLCDDVYPYIRKKYNLSGIAVVEHSIRNAIKSSYNRYLNGTSNSRMQIFNKKPSNREFLMYVTQEVCRRMCIDLLDSNI